MTAERPLYDPAAGIETFGHVARQREEPPLLPRISDAMFRTVAMVVLRTVAELENSERIDAVEADRRVAVLTRFNRGLSAEVRSEAYEQLREALKRLDYVRSDMWDPAEGDRFLIECAAEDDVESAIGKLVGRRM